MGRSPTAKALFSRWRSSARHPHCHDHTPDECRPLGTSSWCLATRPPALSKPRRLRAAHCTELGESRRKMARPSSFRLTRRDMLKLSGAGAGAFALTSSGFAVPRGIAGGTGGGSLYLEAFPTSPLILSPFTDELPIPQALRPADE